MACNNECDVMTGGIPKGCNTQNSGGIQKVYITNQCLVESVTEDSPDLGVITGISLTSGNSYYEFSFNKNTSTWTEKGTFSVENGSSIFVQGLTLKIPYREVSKRNTIMTMALQDLSIIVLDENGKYHLLGEQRGMFMADVDGVAGVQLSDFNGWTLTFAGQEPVMARVVDPSIISGLIA